MTHLEQVPISNSYRQRAAELEFFRAELEQHRQFHLEQLTGLACDAATTSDGAISEVTSSLMKAARIVLAEIDAALFRLAIGSFGVCQRCSVAIPSARLRALPMAALCLPCQYEQESACRRPASMESVVRRGTTS